MKIKHFFLFALCIFPFINFSQGKKIKAYLNEKQFYSPELGNYIEIQLQYVGYSLEYKEVLGGLQSEIGVLMKVKQKDSLIDSDMFRLQSPIMKDSIIDDFYDIKRFALKPGTYELFLELKDLNTHRASLTAEKTLVIRDFAPKVGFSDIEIAESATKGDESSVFFKSGYNIIPRLSNYYPEETYIMPVYLEIYNSTLAKEDAFALKQVIINKETGLEIEEYSKTTKLTPAQVVPFARAIDIQNLASGNYTLKYSYISKEMKEICSTSYDFIRSNSTTTSLNTDNIILDPAFQASITKDSALFYLASLIPIAQHAETKNILAIYKSKSEADARKLIQGFWITTSGSDAYNAWMKYKAQVLVIEKLYKNNFQAGYETDQGRVYLQYGPPSSVVQREASRDKLPYEIWQYNKIGKFSNKRFVFYNPELVASGYRLLHSDMVGELKNSAWPDIVSGKNRAGAQGDLNQNPTGAFGSSGYYFNQY